MSSNDLINGGILCLETVEHVVHDAKLGGTLSLEELWLTIRLCIRTALALHCYSTCLF
jgi:hypothetical protein